YRGRTGLSYYGRSPALPPTVAAGRAEPAADRLLAHEFAIPAYETPTYNLGPEFDWHIFPTVDVEWPTKIHRHFHWGVLTSAYARSGNEAYAREVVQQLFDFAQDNPLERWDAKRYRWAWSTLNTTVRIYSSWLNAWLQLLNSPSWTPDAQFVLMTELREHGRFLMAHAARGGNWVVAEARGLVELGIMFPEFKEAAAWRAEGFRRLRYELDQQVLADGMHIERTPGYHGMTLGCFLEPFQLGLLNQVEIADQAAFLDALERMHEYYLYGQKPNHRMEQVGDSSMMSADGSLAQGARLFRREDMRWVRTNGAEGQPPVHRSYGFTAGGQYYSRSAWNDPQALWSMLDWGAHFGHCHEDMGQFSLYAYGSDLLVDTGIYCYDRPRRDPFYQTIGHNTVMVDQQTQKRRDPLESKWVTTDQFDYFRGLTDNSEPLRFERTMLFRQPNQAGPGYWLVLDNLTGEGRHRLDQRWHTTEKLAARVVGSSIVLTSKPAQKQPSLVLAGLPQAGLQTAVVPGAVSYKWLEKSPVEVAQFTLDGEMPAGFVTLLYPTPPDAPPATVELTRLTTELPGALALRASITDRDRQFEDLWLFNPTGQGTLRVAGVETDARLALLRREGQQTSWLLAEGSLLRQGETVLFTSANRVDGAAAAPHDGVTALVVTAGQEVWAHSPGQATVNGQTFAGERAHGMIQVGSVSPPMPVKPPKSPGEPDLSL
ncbi:MAG: alginate lyase family protein, partial [Armatimonadetes bacterium]|nr:alginate lyase family protein [Armatimonadota bacterium]